MAGGGGYTVLLSASKFRFIYLFHQVLQLTATHLTFYNRFSLKLQLHTNIQFDLKYNIEYTHNHWTWELVLIFLIVIELKWLQFLMTSKLKSQWSLNLYDWLLLSCHWSRRRGYILMSYLVWLRCVIMEL